MTINTLKVTYWHGDKRKDLPYERMQEIPVEQRHAVIDEIISKGYNVMLLCVNKETGAYVIGIDEGRFTQR